MARPRTIMQTLRDILRLTMQLGLSGNQAQRSLGISRGTVQDCVKRAHAAGLTWASVSSITDEELEELLYPRLASSSAIEIPDFDWAKVHRELKRKGVTLRLLWEEVFSSDKKCLSYSQFCRRYRIWLETRDVVMRQEYKGGEKLFVDYAGQTVRITDRETGEVTSAEIFIATFGASNYSFFEAFESQELRHWLTAHIHALRFFGGVPTFVVPDNLKSAVTDACRWGRVLNRSYQRLAEYYGFGILPARPYKPRDKSKVEKAVQHVEQRALAKLRDFTFFSLDELNQQLVVLRDELNQEPFQKLPGSRCSWFESIDKPALLALPELEFESEEWKLSVQVPKDYHLELSSHYYSVPYKLVGDQVDLRYTAHIVEALHNGTRVASHVRNWAAGQKTTAPEHLAPTHAFYHGLTPDWFIKKAALIGPNTKAAVEFLLNAKPHPQLNYDQCFGLVKSLKTKYGDEELELACGHALRLGAVGYRVIRNILEAGVRSLPEQMSLRLGNIQHPNIRGPEYFH